jgi:hypothetical protein
MLLADEIRDPIVESAKLGIDIRGRAVQSDTCLSGNDGDHAVAAAHDVYETAPTPPAGTCSSPPRPLTCHPVESLSLSTCLLGPKLYEEEQP